MAAGRQNLSKQEQECIKQECIKQECIDQENASFWNELCGSNLARQLGVLDSGKESLAKFDNYYFDYYPYLKSYLFLESVKNKKVLEVGLGYGTVSQLLACSGAEFHGLDIARSPVEMARHRLSQWGLSADLRVGNILECPYENNTFDFVFSIGCFHHTGNTQECVNQTYRILKPGGFAMIMLYNKFSLRQIEQFKAESLQNFLADFLPLGRAKVTDEQRRAYDFSATTQKAAPETQFFSEKDIRRIFNAFKKLQIRQENFDESFELTIAGCRVHKFKERKACLQSIWAKYFGLDFYITAMK